MTLTVAELLRIAGEAGVFGIMGRERRQVVKVDYIAARPAIAIPRERDEEGPLSAYPPEVIELTYVLEDSMFAGTIYVALTCGGKIVVHPFEWDSYDKLTTLVIPS